MLSQKLHSAKEFVKEHPIEIGVGALFATYVALVIKYPDAFPLETEPENALHIYHHNV